MENMQKNIKVIWWIKSLLASYIVTGILLLVLTFFMYKFELNEKIVSAAIVGIYVVSTLIGGVIIGKLTKSKRYLWGMVLGIIYFVLLLLITLGVYRTLNGDSVSIVTSLILWLPWNRQWNLSTKNALTSRNAISRPLRKTTSWSS